MTVKAHITPFSLFFLFFLQLRLRVYGRVQQAYGVEWLNGTRVADSRGSIHRTTGPRTHSVTLQPLYKTFVTNFVRCDLSVFWYFKELIHMCVSSQSALYLIYILLSINDIQRQIPVDNSQVMSTACLISADRDYIYISLYFEK